MFITLNILYCFIFLCVYLFCLVMNIDGHYLLDTETDKCYFLRHYFFFSIRMQPFLDRLSLNCKKSDVLSNLNLYWFLSLFQLIMICFAVWIMQQDLQFIIANQYILLFIVRKLSENVIQNVCLQGFCTVFYFPLNRDMG